MRLTHLKSRTARDGPFLLLKSGCCRPPLPPFLLACALLLACLATPLLAAPVLESDKPRSRDGFYQLHWAGPEGGEYELQEAHQGDFAAPRTLYRGPDRATTLTGRPDGEYHYRLRHLGADGPGPWSETLRVEVDHHPLSRALLFFAMGGLVFLATLAAILVGNRKPGDGA